MISADASMHRVGWAGEQEATMVEQQTAVEQLQALYEREKAENGLIEMTFCPGSDRDVGKEEAARVALAMLNYAPQ